MQLLLLSSTCTLEYMNHFYGLERGAWGITPLAQSQSSVRIFFSAYLSEPLIIYERPSSAKKRPFSTEMRERATELLYIDLQTTRTEQRYWLVGFL